MSDPILLDTPGGFAPGFAVGFDDGSGAFAYASPQRPLPTLVSSPAAPPALEGETTTAILAGPFAPVQMMPVYCTLSGDWQGSVRLMRSTDAGASLHPVTAGGASWANFTGNACEVVWQETETQATLWLECAPVAGTLAYRVSQ